MFWQIYLPLGVFALFFIMGIISAVRSDDPEIVGSGFRVGVAFGILFLFFGFLINTFFGPKISASSIPDIEHPTYLASFSGDKELFGTYGAFIVASGTLSEKRQYEYYFYLPDSNKIAFAKVDAATALIVEDSPDRPYMIKIKSVCPKIDPQGNFWLITSCNNYIPYVIEFHVPQGSVVQEFIANP